MADLMALDLVDKGLVTDQIVLTVGYDTENLKDPERRKAYNGTVVMDHYGRQVPKHAHGTANLSRKTASTMLIVRAFLDLFDRITAPALLVRRVTLAANRIVPEGYDEDPSCFQLDLFTDLIQQETLQHALDRERRRQQAELSIKKKFGKNAILKGMNLKEGATTISRNHQIGGHKAGFKEESALCNPQTLMQISFICPTTVLPFVPVCPSMTGLHSLPPLPH